MILITDAALLLHGLCPQPHSHPASSKEAPERLLYGFKPHHCGCVAVQSSIDSRHMSCVGDREEGALMRREG